MPEYPSSAPVTYEELNELMALCYERERLAEERLMAVYRVPVSRPAREDPAYAAAVAEHQAADRAVRDLRNRLSRRLLARP
ncbi:MAG TPA: hypothetical protein VHN80_20540 [Kineosporiaceae bacterium]|nr:hypothetical protein [Kineosporiaceae bacterium]